jgi:hypothetical protein
MALGRPGEGDGATGANERLQGRGPTGMNPLARLPTGFAKQAHRIVTPFDPIAMAKWRDEHSTSSGHCNDWR